MQRKSFLGRTVVGSACLWLAGALLWAPGCREARQGAVSTEARGVAASPSAARRPTPTSARPPRLPLGGATAAPPRSPTLSLSGGVRLSVSPTHLGNRPASPRGATSGGRAPAVSTVLSLSWGSGPGQAGRLAPREGAPEGPSSLDVDQRGTVYLLDQVNGRVLVAARGRAVVSIPLPSVTYRDVALLPGGGLAALDRSVGQHVVLLARGRPARFLPLLGSGIPEGGGVTALEARADGLWVEWAHQHLVRIADALGRSDLDRPRAWGRFASRSPRWVRAVRAGPHEVVLLARRRGSARPSVRAMSRISFSVPVRQILGLAPHPSGAVTLAAHSVEGARAPFSCDSVILVHLRSDGSEAWRLDLPASAEGLSPLRMLRLGLDGALYFLHLGRRGVEVWRVSP